MNDDNDLRSTLKIIAPCVLISLNIADIIIKKTPILLKHTFLAYIIGFGLIITHENLMFETFRIYEMWLMYYFVCFIISIIN